IRDRRTAAGMSLRELAAAVGIGNVEMGEIERGMRLPDANTATAIRNAIDAASGSGADAAVREALDAIKKAHAAVDDLCNGRRWTMSVPARPDADPDLVIGDALTKAERVIRSLADVPTAPGALRAAHQERDADARRLDALDRRVKRDGRGSGLLELWSDIDGMVGIGADEESFY